MLLLDARLVHTYNCFFYTVLRYRPSCIYKKLLQEVTEAKSQQTVSVAADNLVGAFTVLPSPHGFAFLYIEGYLFLKNCAWVDGKYVLARNKSTRGNSCESMRHENSYNWLWNCKHGANSLLVSVWPLARYTSSLDPVLLWHWLISGTLGERNFPNPCWRNKKQLELEVCFWFSCSTW